MPQKIRSIPASDAWASGKASIELIDLDGVPDAPAEDSPSEM